MADAPQIKVYVRVPWWGWPFVLTGWALRTVGGWLTSAGGATVKVGVQTTFTAPLDG